MILFQLYNCLFCKCLKMDGSSDESMISVDQEEIVKVRRPAREKAFPQKLKEDNYNTGCYVSSRTVKLVV